VGRVDPGAGDESRVTQSLDTEVTKDTEESGRRIQRGTALLTHYLQRGVI
jgi:hypothetical protein